MASAWDTWSDKELRDRQDALLRAQVADAVAPFGPFWRERFRALGISPSSVKSVAGLSRLPAVGERDISPDGDPAAMAALVLQPSETGYAVHATGPAVRRALARRLVSTQAYRQVVETDTRPTSYLTTGLGFRWPLASTRGDLDVVARTGRRLWDVLGLTADDVLVSAVPVTRSAEHLGLEYAALAAGAPAYFPGPDARDVAAALRVMPATTLAAPADAAADLVDDLATLGADLSGVRRLLLVGAPSAAERRAAAGALSGMAATGAVVLAVHAPSGARVLWGECAPGSGLHTYPDVDLVEVVDPETAEAYAGSGPGELVLTQLGMRGSALLRWRTGDVLPGPLESGSCPSCGRRVPRVPSTLARGGLVQRVPDLRRPLDLRTLAGALVGSADVADWRVVVHPRFRDHRPQVVVHLQTAADPADVAVAVAADVRAGAGVLPSQLVVVAADEPLPVVVPTQGPRMGAPVS
ncbi:MAG TPA: hypothetical protein VFJ21_00225 [Mycobacteriales bacterium]|nr:hypothetical protein [Mycobacteriales bacterium]